MKELENIGELFDEFKEVTKVHAQPYLWELGTYLSRCNLTPEQLAARDERRQRRAEQFRNFEIVRIPDDEIPEGMQRVRTPFGDSLEPAED